MGKTKRIRLTLAAFMACTFCHFAHPVHATMERDGVTWWPAEELIGVYEKAEAERRAICGEPPNSCFTEQYFRMINEVPEYKALGRMLSPQLSITSVNPSEGIVKAFYYQNTTSSLIKGIEDTRAIEKYFMGWNEDGNRIIRLDSETPVSDGIPGNHIVYYGDSLNEGENWIPNLKETTLRVDSATLMKNTSGVLNVEVFGGFVASGTFNYSKRLNSPDYENGTECKLYVSDSGVKKYFPINSLASTRLNPVEVPRVKSTNPSKEDTNSETEAEAQLGGSENPNKGVESQPDLLNSSEKATKNQLEFQIGPETKVKNQVRPIPKAPETGENNATKYSPEQIWWFAALMVFGVLLIIWWFIPTKVEKSRKKYKKCRKSIDKSGDLR